MRQDHSRVVRIDTDAPTRRNDFRAHRVAGVLLAIGGVGFFAAGAVHPAGQPGQTFQDAITAMLHNPMWPVAHWCALVSAFLVALALFLLIEERESLPSKIGIRLGVIATGFMAVEFAVELAARSEVARLAAGEPAPMIALVDAMQAVGFPALAVAFALLATGSRWTPRWVAVLGIIGAIALGIGGLIVQGMHVVSLGWVFPVGNLLAVWMIWAGVNLARSHGGDEPANR